jgi:uncharacterized protein (TIRG00374 family)
MSEIEEKKKKSKKGLWKYFLYIFIVLAATAISLTISLSGGKFNSIVEAFNGANIAWVFSMVGIVLASFIVDAFIIKIFCRLYTRRYHLHQGMAVAMIGSFYNNVTPSASGGQIMQVYTLRSQGIQISNGASILVMWFILYQSSLIGFDIVTLAVEGKMIAGLKPLDFGDFKLPMVWVIVLGFVINLGVILFLYMMSFSHRIHNFFLHYVIGFLAKIRILKNPEKTRENLRVQVENFKIELRRLQTNIPVTILIVICFLAVIFLRNSIPYFAALSLNSFGTDYRFNFYDMMDATFLASFHQMCAGIIPLPGQAGISEYFFYYLYHAFFEAHTPAALANNIEANINAAQILWRTMTFYVVLLVGGVVAALYRGHPHDEVQFANRQTFVDLQLATFDERKRSADTLYETKQLSRKEIQKRLAISAGFGDAKKGEGKEKPAKVKKEKIKKRRAKKSSEDDGWGTLNID